jgi:hypothetical protein
MRFDSLAAYFPQFDRRAELDPSMTIAADLGDCHLPIRFRRSKCGSLARLQLLPPGLR